MLLWGADQCILVIMSHLQTVCCDVRLRQTPLLQSNQKLATTVLSVSQMQDGHIILLPSVHM